MITKELDLLVDFRGERKIPYGRIVPEGISVGNGKGIINVNEIAGAFLVAEGRFFSG